MRPTIVLVHGAFAESASWDRVIQARFHGQFAADVPAARMAATQGRVTQEAFEEPSGERPLWKDLPLIVDAAALRVAA
jgi:pimeloyl-ACP methyl ester carboxylesterase